MYNPWIRGWVTYYTHFCKTQLRPTLRPLGAISRQAAPPSFPKLPPKPALPAEGKGKPPKELFKEKASKP